MFTQINTQALTLSKNLADAAFKAHSLAMEGLERINEMNLKIFETQANAMIAFWSHASEARDMDSLKSIWPKSVNLVKESAEKIYNNTQEVLGVSLKTSEALGELAKDTFESANESFAKQANTAKKPTMQAGK